MPAVRPGATAPATGAALGGVAVVAQQQDKGLVAQLQLVDRREDLANAVVQRGQPSGIGSPPRVADVLEQLEPPILWLERVVRHVERQVQEERSLAVLAQESAGLAHRQVREERPVLADFHVVAPQVVVVGLGPDELVRVVVDAAVLVAEELIEPLRGRAHARCLAQVPLAEAGGAIAGLLEHLGHCELRAGQAGIAAAFPESPARCG